MIDSHVHTELSGHGRGRAPEYARHAVRNGVEVLTFTEHMPIPEGWDPDGEYTVPLDRVPTYIADVREAAGVPGVQVLCGAEIDWLPDYPDIMQRNVGLADFDLVLGSIHFVGDWAFDDPRLVSRYEETDVDALWRSYFRLLEDAASSGLYDVMSHPDLVKKFGFMPSFDPAPLYESAARTFAAVGVAIEVSTAGLRKPCKEIYPAPAFLDACFRAGVPATISSDSHRPEDVGWGFDLAVDALVRSGYDRYVYHVQRSPVEVEI